VLSVCVFKPIEFGLVMPPIFSVAAVLIASAHVPPLSASVIVTSCAAPTPVAEQLVKPVRLEMVTAPAGTV
jgi:hypothetical protein